MVVQAPDMLIWELFTEDHNATAFEAEGWGLTVIQIPGVLILEGYLQKIIRLYVVGGGGSENLG